MIRRAFGGMIRRAFGGMIRRAFGGMIRRAIAVVRASGKGERMLRSFFGRGVLVLVLALMGSFASGLLPFAAFGQQFPAPDPPVLESAPGEELAPRARTLGIASADFVTDFVTEWTLHKTADGAHPDGVEQAYVWLMNRARRDPVAEGLFLAATGDARIQGAISYFKVNLTLLRQEFAAIAPKPPAAFDVRLYEAALAHSLDLIDRDAQDHDGQFVRVDTAGFEASGMRGNVFSYSRDALYGHAAFNIDWGGNDATGMQTGRGHRKAIMSMDGDYTNVGIAAVPELDPDTRVGPSVVTGNYARAKTSGPVPPPDHHNRFLVGTVWEDLDDDGLYDPGEGIEGAIVMPSAGPYFAVTASGGGYAIPMLAAGPIEVRFDVEGLAPFTAAVDVQATSVLLDFLVTPAMALPVPEPGAALQAIVAVLALAATADRRRVHRRRIA